MHKQFPGLLLVLFVIARPLAAAELSMVLFNVESDHSERRTLGDQVARYYRDHRVDVWGFAEVWDEDWVHQFTRDASRGYEKETGKKVEFESVFGTTGGDNRLLLVYNPKRIELLEWKELDGVVVRRSNPAPLAAHLRVRGGPEFMLVLVRLDRYHAEARQRAAANLRDWARTVELPLIVAGTFEFGWSIDDGGASREAAFDTLLEGEVLGWSQPGQQVATECAPGNKMEDLVFLGGAAREWPVQIEVLSRKPNYCPDTDLTSSHRPLLMRIGYEEELAAGQVVATPSALPPGLPPARDQLDPATREELLRRISVIEAELDALKALLGVETGAD